MHYKNGKEAHEGDSVIGESFKGSGVIVAGKIHNLQAGSTTCNCTVAVPVFGGIEQMTCRNVSDHYHAADAFAAIEAQMNAPAQDVAPAPSCGCWQTTTPKFL